MSLKVFYTSVSGNLELKKRQERIFSVLQSKKIQFEAVDIAQCPNDKESMRKIVGNPTALPPQICKGDEYCGDFVAFENAVEMEQIESFLKI